MGLTSSNSQMKHQHQSQQVNLQEYRLWLNSSKHIVTVSITQQQYSYWLRSMQLYLNDMCSMSSSGRSDCSKWLWLPKSHKFHRDSADSRQERGVAILQFEQGFTTLYDVIYRRSRNNDPIIVQALWKLLFDLSTIATIFEDKLSELQIQPESLYVNKQLSVIRMPTPFTSIQCQNWLRKVPKEKSNISKEDMDFIVGLILAKCILLDPMDLNDKPSGSLIKSIFKTEYYPVKLRLVVAGMIQPNKHHRITCSQILKLLSPHSHRIQTLTRFHTHKSEFNSIFGHKLKELDKIANQIKTEYSQQCFQKRLITPTPLTPKQNYLKQEIKPFEYPRQGSKPFQPANSYLPINYLPPLKPKQYIHTYPSFANDINMIAQAPFQTEKSPSEIELKHSYPPLPSQATFSLERKISSDEIKNQDSSQRNSLKSRKDSLASFNLNLTGGTGASQLGKSPNQSLYYSKSGLKSDRSEQSESQQKFGVIRPFAILSSQNWNPAKRQTNLQHENSEPTLLSGGYLLAKKRNSHQFSFQTPEKQYADFRKNDVDFLSSQTNLLASDSPYQCEEELYIFPKKTNNEILIQSYRSSNSRQEGSFKKDKQIEEKNENKIKTEGNEEIQNSFTENINMGKLQQSYPKFPPKSHYKEQSTSYINLLKSEHLNSLLPKEITASKTSEMNRRNSIESEVEPYKKYSQQISRESIMNESAIEHKHNCNGNQSSFSEIQRLQESIPQKEYIENRKIDSENNKDSSFRQEPEMHRFKSDITSRKNCSLAESLDHCQSFIEKMRQSQKEMNKNSQHDEFLKPKPPFRRAAEYIKSINKISPDLIKSLEDSQARYSHQYMKKYSKDAINSISRKLEQSKNQFSEQNSK